ncbi:restriction endonuclease subunit S [Sulfitobacter sp. 1A12126]|uniref:restriction endonuclease subunit S n=1 Tax=Sulfitobacter sp. 1A12126 TaxID=3368591 RepID=UPI00374504D0
MSDLEEKRREVRQRLIEENEFPTIPENWGVERLRFLFSESKERNGNSPVGEMLSVSEYRGVVPREYEHEEQKRTDDELENYRVVRPGQLAVNSMWLNHLGLGVSEHTGHVSPAYNVYDISERLDRRFVHHLMRSNYYLKIYLRYLYGIRPNSFQIKSNDWASIPIIVPDLPTQRQIADFLDRETARIDLLIEKKQRLVALLREKAKSVNELFFINSDATGIQPLHRLYRVVTGKTPSRNEEDNFSGEDGLPWATPANLGFLAPVVTTKEYLTAKGSSGQPVVDAGTVLLNGIGASVGKIGIAGTKLSFNQQIHALMSKKRVLADRFLFFQLLTLKEQLVLLANSTTLPILNAERLGRLELKVFDLEDQRRHCANMDALLQHEQITAQKINASIERLKEYRSALITAAVTGQIDVSTYAKSGTLDRRLDAIQEEMGA